MRPHNYGTTIFLTMILVIPYFGVAAAADGARARDLGIPFEGTPGPLNAITDIAGVEVGPISEAIGAGNGQPTSESRRISATAPAVLGTNARKAVTGVAAPS